MSGAPGAEGAPAPSATPPPADRRERFLLAALLLACVVVYLPALGGGFVYDDRIEVVGNPALRALSDPATVTVYNVNRPLLLLSWAIDWRIGGLDPFGYHLGNVLLHVLDVFLAWRLARWLLPPARALVAAALWGLHPMASESVAYVTGRSDLLCAAGWLLAMEAHLAGRRLRTVAGILLAVGAKEVGWTLPLVLPVLDAVRGRPWARGPVVAGAGVVALAVVARLGVMGLPAPEVERAVGVHLAAQAEAWTRSLALWVVPWGQSVFHDLPARAWPGGALACALGALGAFAWHRGGLARLAAVLWAAWLLPASAVPLREVMAEHRALLGGLGLAWFLAAVPGFTPRRAAGIAVVLAAVTAWRAWVWADEVRLWQDAVRVHPASASAHYALGDALRLRGRMAEAEGAYRAALSRDPGHRDARVNLGITRAEQGDDAGARALWQEVLRADPGACAAHNNLAALGLRAGRVEEAVAGWQSALRACPGDLLAHLNLGLLYARAGDVPRGVYHLDSFLARAPGTHPLRDGAERARARMSLAPAAASP
ncbi:MAG: hypothetical protein RLZZ299_243 [Pseudomonadota bacterium]